MKKFIALKVSSLRLEDIGGLVSETVVLATPQTEVIGVVAATKLNTLTTVNNTFHDLMNKQRGSMLTPQIQEKDVQRDVLFAEIKRTVKTAQKSSSPNIAAAGSRLVTFFLPFWNIDRAPMMSQTDQINLINARYNADPSLSADAIVLGISTQITNLFVANMDLQTLYNSRLNEMAAFDGASASSIKGAVVQEYDDFCVSVETILSALPTALLQTLFNEMNDIRRKYISRLPTPLDSAHTSVAPITEQIYTGRHLTPLPRVYFQADSELRELIFAQDFTVTYRNNVEVGEAKLFVHGKGKYTGRYETTFHIVRES